MIIFLKIEYFLLIKVSTVISDEMATNDLENVLSESDFEEIGLKIQRIHPHDKEKFRRAIFEYMNNGTWLARTGIGKEVPEDSAALIEAYVYLRIIEKKRVDIVDKKLFVYN